MTTPADGPVFTGPSLTVPTDTSELDQLRRKVALWEPLIDQRDELADQLDDANTRIERLTDERDAARQNHRKVMKERDELVLALRDLLNAASIPILLWGPLFGPQEDRKVVLRRAADLIKQHHHTLETTP